jgi:hypothetical protein
MTILSDILALEVQILQRSGYGNSIELKVYQAIQALADDIEAKHIEEMALLERILESVVGPETGSFNPQSVVISSPPSPSPRSKVK